VLKSWISEAGSISNTDAELQRKKSGFTSHSCNAYLGSIERRSLGGLMIRQSRLLLKWNDTVSLNRWITNEIPRKVEVGI
jgi:hypothetical protein